MGYAGSARRSRQQAVGRFREARLARRADDLAERQSMFLDAAERVMELTQANRDMIAGYREARASAAEALRHALAAQAGALRDASRADIARNGEARAALGDAGRNGRAAFVASLREDVARIVTEDFGPSRPGAVAEPFESAGAPSGF